MESNFSKNLKSLSKTALKVIIRGTGLKTKYELILWKFYIEDKSYVEIADEMGIELTSVGKTLWKAWFEDIDVAEGKAYRYYMNVAKPK